MKRILTVLGARPQFIKASVVSEVIRTSGTLSEVVVHTGQHFDPNMSDVFFIGTRGDRVKPYGDGDAAHRIVRRICGDLGA
jgi:UDP-N-acetylglucosamine 2-epimerase